MGRSTAVRTMTIVNRPAIGTPAAPMLARVAVMLKGNKLLGTDLDQAVYM